MKPAELLARLLMITGLGIVLVPAAIFLWPKNLIEIHASMSENGGWSPAAIQAQAGVPLHLRLTSDDVTHGFAVGQMDMQPVDVVPGKVTDVTLTFDKPGTYTFYCTRWCGINHWRMRGTIEVTGPAPVSAAPVSQPLYVKLGLDIDVPHPASVIPAAQPSALRGRMVAALLPGNYLTRKYLNADYYLSHSPAQVFGDLRADPGLKSLDDGQVWDLVAWIWQSNLTPFQLAQGRQLYTQNCAACHGEKMTGDGVFAERLALLGQAGSSQDMQVKKPANLADATSMLGASPALLEGKIMRGGMGTGMPMWGSIFTDEQIRSLVGYLYTCMFDYSHP